MENVVYLINMSFGDLLKTIWQAILQFFPIHIIPENIMGVRWRFGQIDKTKSGGILLTIPFIDKIDLIDITIGAFSFEPQSVTSHDGITMVIQLGVTYHVADAALLLLTVGDNDVEAVTAVIGRGIVAEVVKNYGFGDIIHSQKDVETEIEELLNMECKNYGLECDKVSLLQYSKVIGIKLFGASRND